MAWRITWRRDDRERTFALMRQQVALWTDETGQLLLEAPPDGWVWATLTEDEQTGPLVRWHDPPEDIELIRDGRSVDMSTDCRDWSVQSGDQLRLHSSRVAVEIRVTSMGNGADRLIIDRGEDDWDPGDNLSRRMWELHRELATGAGWRCLFRQVVRRARKWPGMEAIDGCGTVIWQGEGEFYHRVIWHDEESVGDIGGDGPRQPDALASLLTRQPQLLKALKQKRIVCRRHDEETVDLLLPVGEEVFLGALYLVGQESESFDPDASWRLVDLFNPAAIELVRRARGQRQRRSLEEENRYFRDRERRHYLFKDLVCESEVMRKVYDALNDRVDDDMPIWLSGEAGTGKELMARAAHHLGGRKDAMLIRMGCADFPRELVDFELFGCVASELTGAVAARKGIFELAEGGTVFLDEVDCLSPMVQGKLVRLIQEREVRRVGDAVGRPVDARLIVSSHRDLKKLCNEGRFRPDLYELLEPYRMEVPPLRERRADILPLARIFLKKFVDRYDAQCRVLGEKLQKWLLSYSWPGNVRQLQTVMEAAVLVARDHEVVEHGDLVMGNMVEHEV